MSLVFELYNKKNISTGYLVIDNNNVIFRHFYSSETEREQVCVVRDQIKAAVEKNPVICEFLTETSTYDIIKKNEMSVNFHLTLNKKVDFPFICNLFDHQAIQNIPQYISLDCLDKISMEMENYFDQLKQLLKEKPKNQIGKQNIRNINNKFLVNFTFFSVSKFKQLETENLNEKYQLTRFF